MKDQASSLAGCATVQIDIKNDQISSTYILIATRIFSSSAIVINLRIVISFKITRFSSSVAQYSSSKQNCLVSTVSYV